MKPTKPKVKYRIEDGVTQSMLGDFLECRKRFLLQLLRWESKGGISKSLRWGSLIHDALMIAYRTIRTKKPKTMVPVFRAVKHRLAIETDKNVKKASSKELAQTMEFEQELAEILLDEYLKEWEEDLKKKWLAVEGVFDVPFRGYRLRGKMDGMFESTPDIRPLETKTSSRIVEAKLFLKLSFDFQSLFYTTAAKQLVKPKDVKRIKGPLYNILRTPGLHFGKKESQGEYMERVREDIQNRPDHYFHRFELGFPDEVCQEFEDELKAKLDELSMWLRGDLATYKNERSCAGFWDCEFLPMCASGGSRVGYSKTRVPFRELLDEEEHYGGGKGSAEEAKSGKAKSGKRKTAKRKKR